MLLCIVTRGYLKMLSQILLTAIFSYLSTQSSAQVISNIDTPTHTLVRPITPDSIHTSAVTKLDSVLQTLQMSSQNESLIQPFHQVRIPYWIFIIFLILFSLLTLVRFRYTKDFQDTFSVFTNNSTFQQVYREASVSGLRPGYMLLNINFITMTSLWIYLIIIHGQNRLAGNEDLILPVAWIMILLLLLLRSMLINITSYIVNKPKEIGFFHFAELQIFRAGGIILFPFILLQFYAPAFIATIATNIGLAILILFFFYRYIRVFATLSQVYDKSLFHFLIYICALEIAPVLIGLKLILNTIQ